MSANDKTHNQLVRHKIFAKNQRLLEVMKTTAQFIKEKYSLSDLEVNEIMRESYADMIAV